MIIIIIMIDVIMIAKSIRSDRSSAAAHLGRCFDMMHYGHMNAFRQGKALGTYLVVGVNSDETITGKEGKRDGPF
jgi:cytidyltransferase-like protein